MTTDPRQCPKCKRMVAPELRDGVAVWKWHGTLTLGGQNTMRPCYMSGRPIKVQRTKLGHQIQKALAAPQCIRCGKPLIAGLNTSFCSLACEQDDMVLEALAEGRRRTRTPDPFRGFRDPDDAVDESTNPSNGWRCPE